jgi:Arc/MetJ-type ribon-helix-helix transcriptional regulator
MQFRLSPQHKKALKQMVRNGRFENRAEAIRFAIDKVIAENLS